jgi:hypothetical protein
MPFWSMFATATYCPCGPSGINPPTLATPADTVVPTTCGAVSAGVNVMVFVALLIAVMVTVSRAPNGSISSVSPTASPTPVRLTTRSVVSPAAAGAASVATLVCE